MESLFIKQSEYTPNVILDLDKNLIEFEGKCYPNNAFDFFEPIMNWLKEYIETYKDSLSTINIKLIYINSSTNQILFEIFDLFNDNKASNTKVYFYVDKEDEDEIDMYEDFKEEFPDLDIQIA